MVGAVGTWLLESSLVVDNSWISEAPSFFSRLTNIGKQTEKCLYVEATLAKEKS